MLLQLVVVAGLQLWGEAQGGPLDPAITSGAPAKLREELLEARLRDQIQVGVSHGGAFDHRVRESAVVEHADRESNNRYSHGVAAHFGQHDEVTDAPKAYEEVQEFAVGGLKNDFSLLGVAAHEDMGVHTDEEVEGLYASFAEGPQKTLGQQCSSHPGYCSCADGAKVNTASAPPSDAACGECDFEPASPVAKKGVCEKKGDCVGKYSTDSDRNECDKSYVCCVPISSRSAEEAAMKVKIAADEEWKTFEEDYKATTSTGGSFDDGDVRAYIKGDNVKDKLKAFQLMYTLDKDFGNVGSFWKKKKEVTFMPWVAAMEKAESLFLNATLWNALKSSPGHTVKYFKARHLLKQVIARLKKGDWYVQKFTPKVEELQKLNKDWTIWNATELERLNSTQTTTFLQLNMYGALQGAERELDNKIKGQAQPERQREMYTKGLGDATNPYSGSACEFRTNWMSCAAIKLGGPSSSLSSKVAWWNEEFKKEKKNLEIVKSLEKETNEILKAVQKVQIISRLKRHADALAYAVEIRGKESDFRRKYPEIDATKWLFSRDGPGAWWGVTQPKAKNKTKKRGWSLR